jgi:hypothetical protein
MQGARKSTRTTPLIMIVERPAEIRRGAFASSAAAAYRAPPEDSLVILDNTRSISGRTASASDRTCTPGTQIISFGSPALS